MERFCLRERPFGKGRKLELLMHPSEPMKPDRDPWEQNPNARVIACSTPSTFEWFKSFATHMHQRVGDKGICHSPWIEHTIAKRLALAFVVGGHTQSAYRARFFENWQKLPDEVILYWFGATLWGYRQDAARAALNTLLSEPDDE